MSKRASTANHSLASRERLLAKIISAVDRALLRQRGPRRPTRLDELLADPTEDQ